MKIPELTPDQQERIGEYRDRYWCQAISTKSADRPRAEAVARHLAEFAGIQAKGVVWVDTPFQGYQVHGEWADSFRSWCRDSFWPLFRSGRRSAPWDSLWDSLQSSLWSLAWPQLRAPLRHSIWASPWDTPQLAFDTYAHEVLDIESEMDPVLLAPFNALAASSFALWLTPDTIILCERPKAVEIVDGRLGEITWRRERP